MGGGGTNTFDCYSLCSGFVFFFSHKSSRKWSLNVCLNSRNCLLCVGLLKGLCLQQYLGDEIDEDEEDDDSDDSNQVYGVISCLNITKHKV